MRITFSCMPINGTNGLNALRGTVKPKAKVKLLHLPGQAITRNVHAGVHIYRMNMLNSSMLGRSPKVRASVMNPTALLVQKGQSQDVGCIISPVAGVCFFSTRSTSKTYYYDILGITPRATQSQIKNSFYKLSKVYHPDASNDPSSVELFQAISEAYEVLGNRHKRRLYDRGVLNPFSHPSAEHGDEPVADFQSKEGFRQKRRHAPRGRTDAYNFDEFYRQHYGYQREKSKVQKQNMEQLEKETAEYKKNHQIITGCLLGVIIGFAAFMISNKR